MIRAFENDLMAWRFISPDHIGHENTGLQYGSPDGASGAPAG
jgi:hypothetical protein